MYPGKTAYGAGNTQAKDLAGGIVIRQTAVAGLRRSPVLHSAE
jgi:hypothetical protein